MQLCEKNHASRLYHMFKGPFIQFPPSYLKRKKSYSTYITFLCKENSNTEKNQRLTLKVTTQQPIHKTKRISVAFDQMNIKTKYKQDKYIHVNYKESLRITFIFPFAFCIDWPIFSHVFNNFLNNVSVLKSCVTWIEFHMVCAWQGGQLYINSSTPSLKTNYYSIYSNSLQLMNNS